MMRTLAPITALEFTRAVGREPINDDLERANCAFAGEPMHWGCGWCEHGLPTWACQPCTRRLIEASYIANKESKNG
jgi:hypothetical protein